MQSLNWYWRRLASMSAGEIAWRLRARVRDSLDAVLAPARARPLAGRRICGDAAGQSPDAWCTAAIGDELPEPGILPALEDATLWRDALIDEADLLCAHRVTLFDLEHCPLGDSIRWNFEYKAQKPTPATLASGIDYRDYRVTGDCKFAWELSRHQHWVVLARAYRLTGERAYAQEILDQIESWMRECPFGYGMQWRSPLELGVRLINWAWALELIRPSGLLTPELTEALNGCVFRHLWEIARKYSRYSSANNHLVGEAAGVFVGSAYFTSLRAAERWRRESQAILGQEIIRQTHPDGGTREQASGYHLFSLEFFLIAGLAGRRTGMDFGRAYWRRLESMLDFAAALTEGGTLPMLGDADDGYVLDLGTRRERVESLLAIGAVLFDRPEWKPRTGHVPENVYWLLGPGACETLAGMDEPAASRLVSRALPASGCYLLQSGRQGQDDAVSVVMDCGPLGMEPLAAHGHADALSFVLRMGGWDILVDPGTYDYFTYPAWREYFRSTRAHNTVVVDGFDQSEQRGAFLWGRPAQTRVLAWEPRDQGGRICAEHDGYMRLRRGVMHRRTLEVDAEAGELIIVDELEGQGAHTCTFYLHVGEGCEIEPHDTGFTLISGRGALELAMDACWESRLLRASESPPGGWVSRGYHRKTPSITICASCTWQGALRSCNRVSWPVKSGANAPMMEYRDAAAMGAVGQERSTW